MTAGIATQAEGGSAADVVLAGGGLANSLIALRLKALRPELRVVMLERAAAPDAGRTWSFFDTDVPAGVLRWLKPLCAASWSGYDVRFPQRTRTLTTGYNSITSETLTAAVEAALGPDLRWGESVERLTPDGVTTGRGEQLSAPLVIDGRGAAPSGRLALAWQKFVGVEQRLSGGHGLRRPVVMDATVMQKDGYRFFYVLPFSGDRLLIEDTRYSDSPDLDAAALAGEVERYGAQHGWPAAETLKREKGVLPIALAGDIDGFWAEQDDGVPKVGMRAALFHPTTGYSLPDAARLADEIAQAPGLNSAAVDALVRARSRATWRERGFYRALNRMMFLAAEPEARWRILQRFYGLPQPLIERFYAGRTTWGDRARILMGEPPVSIRRAAAALPAGAAFRSRSVHVPA